MSLTLKKYEIKKINIWTTEKKLNLANLDIETEEKYFSSPKGLLKEFSQILDIKNSVNFPNVQLKRTTEHRISIINKNVPAMIGQIATALGELNLNIAEMTNVSRGDIAYNLIDIENGVDEKSISSLKGIENVIDVRLIL